MKILLDECLPRKLKYHFTEYDTFTVGEKKWANLKNGSLLKAAIDDRFDILLTVDKKLKHEQNMELLNITIVVFDVKRNKIELIVPLLGEFKSQIHNYSKNKIYTIK